MELFRANSNHCHDEVLVANTLEGVRPVGRHGKPGARWDGFDHLTLFVYQDP